MGKLDDNVLVHGLRGKVGDLLVFRIRDGQTVVSKKPTKANRKFSPKQLENQETFGEAIIYGKSVIVTPELKSKYEISLPAGKSVYQVALADFLKAPQIRNVDVSKYTGEAGSTIRIRAKDNFRVDSIQVAIYNSDGSLVEKGDAKLHANGHDWIFTAQKGNKNLEGDKLVITATDIPGNVTKSEMEL